MKTVTKKELKDRLEKKNMWCTCFKMKLKDSFFYAHFWLTNLPDGYIRIFYDKYYYVNDNIEFVDLLNVLKEITKYNPNSKFFVKKS